MCLQIKVTNKALINTSALLSSLLKNKYKAPFSIQKPPPANSVSTTLGNEWKVVTNYGNFRGRTLIRWGLLVYIYPYHGKYLLNILLTLKLATVCSLRRGEHTQPVPGFHTRNLRKTSRCFFAGPWDTDHVFLKRQWPFTVYAFDSPIKKHDDVWRIQGFTVTRKCIWYLTCFIVTVKYFRCLKHF